MKKLLLFILTSLTFHSLYAGRDSLRVRNRNTVGLEFYSPLLMNNLSESGSEVMMFNSIFNKSSSQKIEAEQKSRHLAFGISYEHVLKSNILLRLRGGYSILSRTRSEESQFDTTLLNIGIPLFPAITSSERSEKSYSQSQNHLNFFAGIGKRISLTKKFSIDFGLDIAFISEQEELIEYKSSESLSVFSIPVTSENISRSYRSIPTNVFGIGPVLKPTYQPVSWFCISLEAQMFMLGRFSDRVINVTEFLETTGGSSIPGSPVETDSSTLESKIVSSGSEWSWSQISPLIRMGFSF